MDFINDIIFSSLEDRELNEYKVLNYLKNCRHDFNTNRLYPDLTELRLTASRLKTLLDQKTFHNNSYQYLLKKNGEHDSCISIGNDIFENFADMVRWSLTKLIEVIEEGYVIYDFVSSNIEINMVGDLPEYYDEGYLVIPDNKADELMIYQYVCSLSLSSPIPLQSLNTRFLKSIPNTKISLTSKKFRNDLITKINSNIDPAIFVCLTDLDFDIPHTILPVTKKKLLDVIF